MSKMLRLRDNTQKIVEQETKFLQTDNMNDRIDFLVRDYLKLKQALQTIGRKADEYTTGLKYSNTLSNRTAII